MNLIKLSYIDLKSIILNKSFTWYYISDSVNNVYRIYSIDFSTQRIFLSTVDKDSGDNQADFETNYKDDATELSTDNDIYVTYQKLLPQIPQVSLNTPYYGGKPSIRAESRPDGTSSYFTTRGDSESGLGDGTRLEWDFSNSDNEISAPSGYKRKRIETRFADNVWVKEGTVYFYNALKGTYIDFFIVCPDGQYYYDRNGTPQQASGDVVIEHYVVAHPMQDSAPMGDELNTEAATINAVPPSYKFRIEVTTPESDSTSNGYAELELYRERSSLLPGESI